MLRIFKYLKPYIFQLLLAIALLYGQANADLALPDYLSKIVNVGIQQGGVENATPQALRQATMDHLTLFLTAGEKTDVLAQYRLVDSSAADYADLLKTYPALSDGPIYVLTASDAVTINRLNPVMGKALLLVSGIEQVIADPTKAATLMPGSQFDPSKIPAGMDLFSVLKMLPESQRLQFSTSVDTRFAALGGEKALIQAAANTVKAEYQALGMDNTKIQSAYILNVGGKMLLVSLLSVIATVIVGFLSARIAAGLARNLRHNLFQKVMSFSNGEFSRFSTASLITRSTNDITQVQMVVMMMIRMVFYAPIIGIGGILRALSKDVSMWWVIALAVVLVIGIIATAMVIAIPKFKIVQNLIDRLNRVARENLSGMMVVRAFNRQWFEEDRFDKANRDLTDTNMFINRVFIIVMPAMMFIMNSVSMLIIWVGSHQVAQATMQVGDMMAFMQYAMQILFSFVMMSFMFIMIPRADVSANRIADVLETDITILDPEQPETFQQPFRGSVEFRNVSFRYPDAEEDMLHGINFTAQAGQTVGIIGTTGSGKSTVVNLIPRFYDVTGGEVLVDGMDVRKVRTTDLRDQIGYIPQQSNLFSGDIASNLLFADENADEPAMRMALEIAQASEFVFSDEQGLKADVSQGGVNYSGGQKQRLSIARALVKRAPIYIFDDSFSALDYKTDAALRRAIHQNLGDSTVFIVTQRVATIKNANLILVLDEGRVIDQGTHHQLMESCEVYREIALSQITEAEARS
jgi:ATP-binding cassette subfamily B multidrug efflux pump